MSPGHFVYVISESKNGQPCSPVKIGISKDAGARLRTLQTAHARRLMLVTYFTFPNQHMAAEIERAFHLVMANKQTVGEWFDIAPMFAVELMCDNVAGALKCFLGDDQELLNAAEERSGLNENRSHVQRWRRSAAAANDNPLGATDE